MNANQLAVGEKLFADGNLIEAERFFKGIQTNSPDYCAALNNLGVIAFSKGELDQAEKHFLNSLAIDPFYNEAIRNLADLRRTIGPDVIPGALGSSGPFVKGKRLAIVNRWGNKFDQIYQNYFAAENEVRLFKPESLHDLKEITNWADLIWSTWCDQTVISLTEKRLKQPLISHIRSFEILTSEPFENLNGQNLDGAIFVADHVRAVANHVWSEQLSHTAQTTIYNSVVLDDYPFADHSPGKNICFVGYINNKKGMGLLAQCLKQAVKLDSAFRLHIAGEYQDLRTRAYWNHLVKELKLEPYVINHGWVDDVKKLLAEMDYVISTSPWEGCPNNIIEAMALGIKPLIHNWKGAKELFPSELVFSTIDQFVEVLLSSDYNSTGYRSYVAQHFNADRQLRKIDAFIDEVDKQHSSEADEGLVAGADSTDFEKKQIEPVIPPKDTRLEEGDDGFYQKLPSKVELTNNRKQYTINYCKGKKILHVGCVDTGIINRRIAENNHLHHHLAKVAKQLIGIDVNEQGISYLKQLGFEAYTVDIQTDFEQLNKLSNKMDAVVVPEVIEHLDSVGGFLDNLRRCEFDGEVFISTSNAFSFRIINNLDQGNELVHPDHVCYYSPSTINTLLTRYGFEINRQVMYYWETDDEFGEKYREILKTNPYLAEGIIVIARKLP